MITKAYIHEYGNQKLEPEHQDVIAVLKAREIDYELFTSKELNRNQLNLDKNTLIVGNHPTIHSVLKRIGYPLRDDCYPKSLEKYLERNIWVSSVRKLLMESQYQEISQLFVKPKSQSKLFTGFVLHSNDDLFKLAGLSKNTALYCSTCVSWVSEYRVFVNEGKIVGMKHYAGEENCLLDMSVVENAIQDLEDSSEKTAAYGIDFGVLHNGKTALVEWNDGFALGSYQLEKKIYTDLLIARWEEILQTTLAMT